MVKFTYRSAFLFYFISFFLLVLPYWFDGEVITPHRQLSELAAKELVKDVQLENRKLSDYTNSHIPITYEHLSGLRSGWLTLWSNQNELGRPTYLIAGFSPA